jgi:phosphoserine aminotransferase
MGTLYNKETPDFPVARINFNLMETESTKYNKKKWWGDFSLNEALKHGGNYLIGFEDSRKGECIVIPNTEARSAKSKTWYYHFNGRGALGKK